MNSIFDKIEIAMIDALMKKGIITDKKYSDKKKYIKEVVRRLYLNMWSIRDIALKTKIT